MWPEKVIRQFSTVPQFPSEADYHGPYNKLLYTLFPPDTDFVVVPQRFPQSKNAADFVFMYEIRHGTRPVLVIELMPPRHLSLLSKRQEADLQVRSRFFDVAASCPIGTLYGISAMGTKLRFYTLDLTLPNSHIMPEYVAPNLAYMVDTVPARHWEYDILTPQGEDKLREVAEAIIAACANLTPY